MGIFSEQELSGVRSYSYKGGDLSLCYKYIYSPLTEYLAKYTPSWLAPNIITLLDFLSILISHIIIAYYSWDFSTPLPNWVCVVGGVCYFLYFTLDCLDGKQARQTGSSSPLGMMFDHGCDALGSPLSLCNMMALVQSKSPTMTIVCMLIVLTGFYIATYETYYIGGLFLGKINPVTDGSVAITILYIITGILGPQIWTTTIFTISGIPINFFYIVFFMVILGTLFGNVQSFMHIIYDSKEKPSALRMIHEFFSVELLIATVAILHYTTSLWKNHTRIMIYIFGIMFTKLNVYTLAMQIVKSPLKICIKSIVVPCGLLLALVGVKIIIGDEQMILGMYNALVIAFVSYAVYHLRVLIEVRDTLGIKMFTIKKQVKGE